MATTSISPVWQKTGTIPNRRIPLSSVPNAVNSPYRSASATFKRSRLEQDIQEECVHNQQPPAKRQALENANARFRTPPRKQASQYTEDRPAKRPTNPPSITFEQKLVAAKEKPSNYKTERIERAASEIRQWQRHYRRVFPEFVFYFENIPDDVRIKYSRFVRVLGAREEKFFSKDVTHVITVRDIPGESESNSPTEILQPSTITACASVVGQSRAVDPSCLERSAEPLSRPLQSRNKFTFEKPLGRKPTLSGFREIETRRQNTSHVDILSKAREMNMKIWQLEKLQRIMNSMFDNAADSNTQPGRNTRNIPGLREEKQADLSKMLRNEQLNGASDRDTSVLPLEFVPFKGPYIYVRDMAERTKPILLKEYPQSEKPEDGEWPQFRSVAPGKCPFVDENLPKPEKIKAREVEVVSKGSVKPQTRTRAVAVMEKSQASPTILSTKARHNQPLVELRNVPGPLVPGAEIKETPHFGGRPTPIAAGRRSPVKGLRNVPALNGPRMFGGEPAASGLQPSNLTSAIRSQIISSTAAGPGAKAGTSKEIQGLKRKVLERNSGPALNRIQISQRISHPSRAESSIAAVRQTMAKAKEHLIHIDEELVQYDAEVEVWKADQVAKAESQLSRSIEKKDGKPGYCENCRDKYDNFDEHTKSKEHKKFALTKENWRELDKLLSQLGRRLKQDVECS